MSFMVIISLMVIKQRRAPSSLSSCNNSHVRCQKQIIVCYSMEWLSNQTNVSEAPFLFETWMKNANNSAEFIYLLNKGAGLDLDPNSSIVSVKPQPSSPPTPSPTPTPSAPATKVSNSVTAVVAAVAGARCSLLVGVCLWFFYVR